MLPEVAFRHASRRGCFDRVLGHPSARRQSHILERQAKARTAELAPGSDGISELAETPRQRFVLRVSKPELLRRYTDGALEGLRKTESVLVADL